MKIELRNIESNDRLGREGTIWQAKLYIDDFEAGKAYNHGDGGPTQWGHLNAKGLELIQKAVKWSKTLPPHITTFPGKSKPVSLRMDFEFYLDLLLDKHLEGKQMNKDMKKAILFGVPDSGKYTLLSFKVPISSILANKMYLGFLAEQLREQVFPKLTNGAVILNTNIPEAFHEKLNIKKDQVVAQKEEKQQKKPQKYPNDDLDNRQKRTRSRR